MDNNTNNNVSGIPNVSDIKFDDTPAESFDSLYGGSVQQPVNNATMAQGPGMTPNPGVVPGMTQGPSMTSNPGVVPGMTQGPSMAPNPGVASGMTQGPSMAPNPGVAQPSVDDLSDIEIDEEKMQSIEEQLSKTSQYNPADFQQEKIVIQTDDQYEKNKSGLTFLIVLFVILILAIFLIPHITKFLK